MIIKENKENYSIELTQDELINIWASLLFLKSQQGVKPMPRVDKLIKEFSQLLK